MSTISNNSFFSSFNITKNGKASGQIAAQHSITFEAKLKLKICDFCSRPNFANDDLHEPVFDVQRKEAHA